MTAFRELLGDLLTGLRAGWSVENALRECSGEMRERYGSSRIVKELNRIVNGMDNQIPTEQLLLEFGERSGVEEIRDFATVFAIARRGSGNLAEILQRTGALISDRIETGNEIETLLAGRRLEQHIMDAIPFFLILYIRLTSPGFFTALYHNAAGIAVMSVCLGVYLAALALAERISDIHV